jgi:murein DD-endopeptidase MepM/ murein hydrolase activator NlpD
VNRWIGAGVVALVIVFVTAGALWWWRQGPPSEQITRLRAWFDDPAAHSSWSLAVGERCGAAPMLLPTNGYVGFGWNDSFRPGHQHSGLDIFGPDPENGVTPIVAAYDGYLTREEGWKSTVIIRHPNFPAVPAAGIGDGEQIWTYYTHMASRDGSESYVADTFPPGTNEQFVTAGTLLGYQGNWGGNPWQLTGRHLHFSVVKSDDDDSYRDERILDNTYNPIFLLGLTANANGILTCQQP